MESQFVPAFLIAYSDSDFTNPHEVVLPDDPKDCRGDFTHMGAKYWGLESRRHKATTVLPGELAYDHHAHNWFLIGLKARAKVKTITLSTKWYTGNQVRAVSVFLKDELTGRNVQVLNRQALQPDAEHSFDIPLTLATECFVECYYEGGISRINLFGAIATEQLPARKNLLEGAVVSHVSNAHYGKPDQAVQGDRKEMHMIGWESARTGFGEQALFHLNKPAKIKEIVVDTYMHRLNAPLSCHVFGAVGEVEELMKAQPRWSLAFAGGREVIPDNFQPYMLEQKYLPETNFKIRLNVPKGSAWKPLLPFAPLSPDTFHRFNDLADAGAVTHILYMHYPNGGIHGLRVFGDEG